VLYAARDLELCNPVLPQFSLKCKVTVVALNYRPLWTLLLSERLSHRPGVNFAVNLIMQLALCLRPMK
jgi:hypothetical protein